MPKPPRITEAEWVVMDALWRERPRSAQGVHDAIGPRHEWTLGTVKTLLARLLKKGAVRHEKEGKRFLYRPAFTRQACVRAAGKDLLSRAGRDAESPLLAYFLKESRIGKDEIEELRALLDRLEEERG
ncbi:MAG: BlaI/MecI/CopY family transcriptional regulator [Planctomycetota bacterium]